MRRTSAFAFLADILIFHLIGSTVSPVDPYITPQEFAEIEEPRVAGTSAPGLGVEAVEVGVLDTEHGPEILFEGEVLSLEEFEVRIRNSAPPVLRIRAGGVLAQVIASAHAAGVRKTGLAFDLKEIGADTR